jgi:hypothetical protein
LDLSCAATRVKFNVPLSRPRPADFINRKLFYSWFVAFFEILSFDTLSAV